MGDQSELAHQLMIPALRERWNRLAWGERFEARTVFRWWRQNPFGASAYRSFNGDTGRHVLRCHVVRVNYIEFCFASLKDGRVVLYDLRFLEEITASI